MNSGFFNKSTKSGRPYVVYVPKDARPPHPTILFLHGRGESGKDGMLPLAVGLPLAIIRNHVRWPFLVIIPQKPDFDPLWPTERGYLDEVLALSESEFDIDPHRRYLTGLSQGGNGTFDLVGRLRWQFAAAAPVCGWSMDPTTLADRFRHVPVWAFHGLKDDVILPERSAEAVEIIRSGGGRVKYTQYPNHNHNSWDEAYQQSELPRWLLTQTLE